MFIRSLSLLYGGVSVTSIERERGRRSSASELIRRAKSSD